MKIYLKIDYTFKLMSLIQLFCIVVCTSLIMASFIAWDLPNNYALRLFGLCAAFLAITTIRIRTGEQH